MAVPPMALLAQGPAPRHAAPETENYPPFLPLFVNFFFLHNKGGGKGEIRSEFLLGASHSACNVM